MASRFSPSPIRFRCIAASAIMLSISLIGCGEVLMPTPTLYQTRGLNPFSHLEQEPATNDAPILFVTDRQLTGASDGWFDDHRNYGLTFGSAVIQFGTSNHWSAVSEDLQTKIKTNVPLRITRLNHMGSLPDALRFDPQGNGAPTVANTIPSAFITAVRDGLGDSKQVYLYVHGYNNTFESTAARLAGLWHWLGRRGVAILYSWPSDDQFLGYLKDRESARFTVAHLKAFLTNLGQSLPEDAQLNIIAHSTGVGVVVDALRELKLTWNVDAREAGKRLKLKHFIAAAADLDTDVLLTRAIAEDIHHVAEHSTIYVSGDDLAIRLSNFFYFGITGAGLFSESPFKFPRLGGLRLDQLDPIQRELIDRWLPDVDLIDVSRASVGWIKHDYFTESPAVSSDLILRLRYDLDPVAHPEMRPLERAAPEGRLWRMERDYLQQPSPQLLKHLQQPQPLPKP